MAHAPLFIARIKLLTYVNSDDGYRNNMCIFEDVFHVSTRPITSRKKGTLVYVTSKNLKLIFSSITTTTFFSSHPITAKMNFFPLTFSSLKAIIAAFSVAFLVITSSSNSVQAQVSSVLPFSKDTYVPTRMPKTEFQSVCVRYPKKCPTVRVEFKSIHANSISSVCTAEFMFVTYFIFNVLL